MNINSAKIITFAITALGVIVALLAGVMLADASLGYISLIVSAFTLLFWALMARDAWWLAFAAIASATGSIYVGFRITPIEIGTLIALSAFLPFYVFNKDSFFPPPDPLPKIYLLLGVFFGLSLIGSLVVNRFERIGDDVNVIRVYSGTLSCFGIGFLFYYFATLRYLKLGLNLIYFVLLTSLVAACTADVLGTQIFIPGINYVLDTGFNPEAQGMEFFFARWLAVAIMPFALFYSHCARSPILRMANYLLIFALLVLVVRAGGRAALLNLLLFGLIWLVLTRQKILLVTGLVAATFLLLLINVNQSLLDLLPAGAQRSMSFLVLDPSYSASLGLTSDRGSNTWHDSLREIAYDRWTTSPLTVIVGYGARGFEGLFVAQILYAADMLYANALQAANTGAYEKSIFALLAVTGLVGLLLVATLYYVTARKVVPHIWKNGVHDERDLAMILAALPILSWPLLGWIQGGLPQMELFYIAMALAAYSRSRSEAFQPLKPGAEVDTYAEV